MSKVDITSCIVADPKICHGTPAFKGTRIMVWQILELLETGTSRKDIFMAYPSLPRQAIEAALHFAAERTKGISYVPFQNGRQTQVFT